MVNRIRYKRNKSQRKFRKSVLKGGSGGVLIFKKTVYTQHIMASFTRSRAPTTTPHTVYMVEMHGKCILFSETLQSENFSDIQNDLRDNNSDSNWTPVNNNELDDILSELVKFSYGLKANIGNFFIEDITTFMKNKTPRSPLSTFLVKPGGTPTPTAPTALPTGSYVKNSSPPSYKSQNSSAKKSAKKSSPPSYKSQSAKNSSPPSYKSHPSSKSRTSKRSLSSNDSFEPFNTILNFKLKPWKSIKEDEHNDTIFKNDIISWYSIKKPYNFNLPKTNNLAIVQSTRLSTEQIVWLYFYMRFVCCGAILLMHLDNGKSKPKKSKSSKAQNKKGKGEKTYEINTLQIIDTVTLVSVTITKNTHDKNYTITFVNEAKNLYTRLPRQPSPLNPSSIRPEINMFPSFPKK